MEDELQVKYRGGDHLVLRREQWKGREAQISASDELLEEIKKFHWTLRGSAEHPYLSTKSNGELTYLHTFVLRWLYGDEQFNEMSKGMVIDHLDNDGLNCSFENLCLTSNTWNVIKGQGIDNNSEWKDIPDYIIDVFYLHDKAFYQMQITFNRIRLQNLGRYIGAIYLKYSDQGTMFTDWLYLKHCLAEKMDTDFEKLHAEQFVESADFMPKDVPDDQIIIEVKGKQLLHLRPDGGNKLIAIRKTVLHKIPWEEFELNTVALCDWDGEIIAIIRRQWCLTNIIILSTINFTIA